MSSLHLDPDRALPFPAEQRSIAREIYGETKDLPLICMHGHVEPEVFADDLPFADPAQLLIVPDHYVFRMLASQGIEPARLGVPRLDGGPVETDSRKIWRTFCENWKLFRGTPSRYWLEHELVEVFGVELIPSAETADAIYDQIAACVADPGFRPRALLDRFNIEVISTTDSATSDLRHHAKLAADGLGERVLPTFRPDALSYLDRPTWRADNAELAEVSGIDTATYDGFSRHCVRAVRPSSKQAPVPRITATYLPTPPQWTSMQPVTCTPASTAGLSRVRPKSTRSPRTCSTRWLRCPARTAW